MRTNKASWQRLPSPQQRDDLGFDALFTAAETELLKVGLVPGQMEDKWFIYFDDDWLHFHRSWTGAHIYALRLEGSPSSRVVESWVNRNPDQYQLRDTMYDRKLVRFLIEAFLLKKSDAIFPMPTSDEKAAPGVVQHLYVGRAYPESKSDGET